MKMDRNHGCFACPKGFQQPVGLVYDCVGRALCLFEYDCYCICMYYNKPVHEISNNVVCATSKASGQPAHTRSLIRADASRLSIL